MSMPTRLPILSRSEFHEAVRSAIAEAAASGAREIFICDPTFADWPLGERSVIEDLTRWAGAQRRLHVHAHRYDEITRRHGRWTEWRRQWSHLVVCRTDPELEERDYPAICLIPGVVSVRLFDAVNHRGLASHEASDAVACREIIDALLQRSVETFPATTLGL